VTYLKKPTLPQQQQELQEFIEQRLGKEKPEIIQRVYRWLNDNQYFLNNELFDFYFCVAQNIAAVEVLGASGEKIVRAKQELEESAEAYTTQIADISNWISEQLNGQLQNIEQNQQQLDTKLLRAIEELATRERNLQTISTGLVNSVSVLLKKQQQLVVQTETTTKYVRQTVIIAWIVPIFTLLGCVGILLMNAI
jgi:chromosome segregation ATPase